MQTYNIVFRGIIPNIFRLRLKQQYDSNVAKITFEFDKIINELDITDFTAYIKIDTPLICEAYKDKLKCVASSEEKVMYEWVVTDSISQYKNVDLQISFESGIVKFSTKIFSISFDASINADELIEKNYPGVLQDIEERLKEVEKKSHIEQYDSLSEFPTLGDVFTVYVDKEKNKIYRWNNEDNYYYCIGSDYEQIKIVNGGSL